MPERSMVFVDGSNLFHSLSSYEKGYRIDMFKLVEVLTQEYDNRRTYYYASQQVPPVEKQTRFYSKLEYGGFQNDIKDLVYRNKRFEHVCSKCGNKDSYVKQTTQEKGVDVALSVEFVAHSFKHNFDTGFLVSGDKDMARAVNVVKDSGKRVIVASFRRVLSDELRREADRVLELDQIAEDIRLTA